MKYGFTRMAAAIPSLQVADCTYNTEHIIKQAYEASKKGVSAICFPELCITGYTCQDLFQSKLLLDEAKKSLLTITKQTAHLPITIIVGLPLEYNNLLYNCAAVVAQGSIVGIVPKSFLPNNHEFYEQRWFVSAFELTEDAKIHIGTYIIPFSQKLIFSVIGEENWKFGIEICEDLWAPLPPSTSLVLEGADVIFNLSASNSLVGKNSYRQSLIENQSARCLCGYVYSSCGFGESTQDLVFTGHGLIVENGSILAKAEEMSLEERLIFADIDIEKLRLERRMSTSFAQTKNQAKRNYQIITYQVDLTTQEEHLLRSINPLPFVPQGTLLKKRCEEILYIQAMGLAKRLLHTHSSKVILGISGGLDSTLALIVCIQAFDLLHLNRKGIIGVTMPGYGTTNRTYANAITLMKSSGITSKEISIRKACEQHFSDIGHDGQTQDITFENAQARERTQILMDLSNLEGGLLVGTGDLSELALGWATYNGDHMSMYAVNISVPKTLVRHLVKFTSEQTNNPTIQATLLDIVNTPISPELISTNKAGNISQYTEALVGPYELHDFFLYYTLRFGMHPEKIFYLAIHAFDGHDERTQTYSKKAIKHWLTIFFQRFFAQQFKRSCLPDGPKVGSCALSPRGDWRMPSDASSALWLKICENLPEA